MKAITLEPISRIEGEINLPGSKSLSNRALLLAALAKGTTTVTNLLDSDDIRHMLNALKALGVNYQLSEDKTCCEVEGLGGAFQVENGLSLFLGSILPLVFGKSKKSRDDIGGEGNNSIIIVGDGGTQIAPTGRDLFFTV